MSADKNIKDSMLSKLKRITFQLLRLASCLQHFQDVAVRNRACVRARAASSISLPKDEWLAACLQLPQLLFLRMSSQVHNHNTYNS
jgi:hypothetical protein